MGTRERPADRGSAEARRLAIEAARELRRARRERGLSQREVGHRAAMSDVQVSRLERGRLAAPSLDQLVRLGAAVGLRASLRFFPIGPRVHDRAQLALLERFEALLAPPLRMQREAPMPIPGDLRAWDGRIVGGAERASVEAESRLEDLQALARRIALKQRDDPEAVRVILVVNRTAHNRRVLAEHREALRAQFPLDGAAIIRALRAGRVPPASGIVVL